MGYKKAILSAFRTIWCVWEATDAAREAMRAPTVGVPLASLALPCWNGASSVFQSR
jgi:hypothetical protein